MAVEVPYTRDHVYAWLIEFREQDEVTDLREWMTDKLGADALVRVRGKALIDYLMDTIGSYEVEDAD